MQQLKLTETILMLIVIVIAIFTFNCVFKRTLEGLVNQPVKTVSLKKVGL